MEPFKQADLQGFYVQTAQNRLRWAPKVEVVPSHACLGAKGGQPGPDPHPGSPSRAGLNELTERLPGSRIRQRELTGRLGKPPR